MKKLLSTMAAITLVSAPSASLIACSDKNMAYYNEFMRGVNNEENFIFMVSAKNCIHCTNTIETTIKDLYSNGIGNNAFMAYLNGDNGNQYNLANPVLNLSVEEQNKIKNTRLIITEDVKKYDGIWSEKWASKLADWIVIQERNAHKINGEIDKSITAKSLGLSGTPTYIYIKNGKYVGFETGEVGNLENNSNPNLWMKRFWKHIVKEDWDIDHNPSS